MIFRSLANEEARGAAARDRVARGADGPSAVSVRSMFFEPERALTLSDLSEKIGLASRAHGRTRDEGAAVAARRSGAELAATPAIILMITALAARRELDPMGRG